MAGSADRRAAPDFLLHLWGHPLQPDLVRHDDRPLLRLHPGACIRGKADRAGAEAAVFPHRDLVLRRLGIPALDGGLLLAEYVSVQPDLLV